MRVQVPIRLGTFSMSVQVPIRLGTLNIRWEFGHLGTWIRWDKALYPPTLIGQLLDPGPFLLRDPQCVRGWGDMTSLLEFIKKFFCQVLIILGHLVSILVTVPSRKKSCSCCCYLFHFFTCGGSRYTCGGVRLMKEGGVAGAGETHYHNSWQLRSVTPNYFGSPNSVTSLKRSNT